MIRTIVDLALNNRTVVLLSVVVLVGIGLWSMTKLPIERYITTGTRRDMPLTGGFLGPILNSRQLLRSSRGVTRDIRAGSTSTLLKFANMLILSQRSVFLRPVTIP